MNEKSYWKVNFTASNEDFESASPILEGYIGVTAKDVFEALEIARDQIKSFGYDKFVIRGCETNE